MVADYLSSLGLVFGMIGAWLLYKFLPPATDRNWTNARRGFLVLLLGFLLQLIAMWIPF